MHITRPWQDDPRHLSLRPFDGSMRDLAALAQIRNATLQATTLPEDFREVSAEELGRFYNGPDFHLLNNCWLMFMGEEPVAATVLYPSAIFNDHDRPPGNFDMYVVPSYWRHGLGSRLLAHLEQAALASGYPALETTIAQEDAQSTGFLARHGFAVVGRSLRLTRYGVNELPDVVLPPGYAIRSLAALGGSPDLYRETANRLGSYDTNYSLIRPEDIDGAVASGRWQPQGVLLLFDTQERIVGIIRASGVGVGVGNGRGYLHEIRLEPSCRGMGLGRAMLASSLRYLASSGVEIAELETADENVAAYSLALRAGFEVTRHWLHFLKSLRFGEIEQ